MRTILASLAIVAAVTAHATESTQASACETKHVNYPPSGSSSLVERLEAVKRTGHSALNRYSVTSLVVHAVSPLMEQLGFVDGMILPIDEGEGPSETNLYAVAVFRNGARKLYASETNYYYIIREPIGGYEAGTVFRSETYQRRTYMLEPGATPTNALCWLAWTKAQPKRAEELLKGFVPRNAEMRQNGRMPGQPARRCSDGCESKTGEVRP